MKLKSTDTWIERVREADAQAELAWTFASDMDDEHQEVDKAEVICFALIAIAAELRAQRIARRPGAGQ